MKKLILGAILGLASLAASAATVSITGNFPLTETTSHSVSAPAPFSMTFSTVSGDYAPLGGVAAITDLGLTFAGHTWAVGDLTVAGGGVLGQYQGRDVYNWVVRGVAGVQELTLGFVYGHAPEFAMSYIDIKTGSEVWQAYAQDFAPTIAYTRTGDVYAVPASDVPVPASAALVVLGLIGVAASRRKHSDFIPA